jgi:hypothetical protein
MCLTSNWPGSIKNIIPEVNAITTIVDEDIKSLEVID